ncbi:hypothetical protein ACFVWR_18915 [Leifsonia sp. NPDC058292]|uniref:hypothetical protein n=1 Tax=Leifsonia sp. NPDC058292 TaxID=3346428 RepID=UPI0036DB374D
MTAPTPPSIQTLIDTYAKDVAFAADEEPATTASEFIDQLTTAAINLDHAGINGTENLDNAAVYLTDALNSTDRDEVKILLTRASRYLQSTTDLVDEYRLML